MKPRKEVPRRLRFFGNFQVRYFGDAWDTPLAHINVQHLVLVAKCLKNFHVLRSSSDSDERHSDSDENRNPGLNTIVSKGSPPTRRKGRRILDDYSTQYTVHSIVHSTQYTVHNTQYTVHSTQDTVHSTQYAVHSTQYTVHSTQYTIHSTQYTLHSTHYTVQSTQYT